MPKRIPTGPIVLYREGKQVVAEKGKEFDFTPAELDSILKSNKGALKKIGESDEGKVVAVATDLPSTPVQIKTAPKAP